MKARLIVLALAACLVAFYMARFGMRVGNSPFSWADGR